MFEMKSDICTFVTISEGIINALVGSGVQTQLIEAFVISTPVLCNRYHIQRLLKFYFGLKLCPCMAAIGTGVNFYRDQFVFFRGGTFFRFATKYFSSTHLIAKRHKQS